MDYQTLSPSACAAECLEEIVKCTNADNQTKDHIRKLIRQKVRLVIEHCAIVAEEAYAQKLAEKPGKTIDEQEALLLSLGDEIAEQIRQFADERRTDRANEVA
jgi:DNA gyrase/topoisomerase IV subunit A